MENWPCSASPWHRAWAGPWGDHGVWGLGAWKLWLWEVRVEWGEKAHPSRVSLLNGLELAHSPFSTCSFAVSRFTPPIPKEHNGTFFSVKCLHLLLLLILHLSLCYSISWIPIFHFPILFPFPTCVWFLYFDSSSSFWTEVLFFILSSFLVSTGQTFSGIYAKPWLHRHEGDRTPTHFQIAHNPLREKDTGQEVLCAVVTKNERTVSDPERHAFMRNRASGGRGKLVRSDTA